MQHLIGEKQKNATLKDKLIDIEVTKLRVELEQVLNEKADIERNYDLLKTTTAGFGRENVSKEIHNIVSNIAKGDLIVPRKNLVYP